MQLIPEDFWGVFLFIRLYNWVMDICRKVRYSTMRAADMVVLEAKIKRAFRIETKRQEVRSYFCFQCRGWHVTSQPKRERPAA